MRVSLRCLSAIVLASSLAAGPVSAQIEKGDKALAVQGLFAASVGTQEFVGFGMAAAGLSFFQTRNLAWHLVAVVAGANVSGEVTVVPGLGGGVEWDFNEQNATTIPYVGVDAVQVFAKDANATTVAANAGLRFFISRSTSFDAAATYNQPVSGGDNSSGELQFRLGFSFFFAKDTRK